MYYSEPCNKLAPKYEEAAGRLKENGDSGVLAKVDATENDKLIEKFGIDTYPTFFFFS